MLSFKEHYKKNVVKNLAKDYGNPFELPRLEKIVVNMGVGEAAQDSKVINHAVNDLTLIAGQKAVITKARKSISGFKVREHMPIGCKVTLRGDRMFHFLERMVLIALPRVRDFRGVSTKSFDGNGNLTIGFKEQIIFPEIDYDKVDAVRGLDVTIVTSARSDNDAKNLLSQFYIPFIN
jgi:large subunit ribosomal protein L5